MKLPEKILNVQDMFAKIPGVGSKTALRNVLSLTKWNSEEVLEFSKVLEELTTLNTCKECGAFADEQMCSVCSDPHRATSSQLCVVETVTDCMAIERSGEYRGVYHILGGVLNPLMGVGPDDLRLNALVQRVKEKEISNIILAVSPSVEGDATCNYLKELLPQEVEVNRIGFGIPMGGNLDYLDAMTITKALENKKRM